MRRRNALPFCVLVILTLTASDCEVPDDLPVASSIEKVSGDAQEAAAGAALPDPLVVRVLDQDGEPVAGAEVTWSTASGAITAGAMTDGDGLTSATWTLGSAAGAVEATATLDPNASVTFTATATTGTGGGGGASALAGTWDAVEFVEGGSDVLAAGFNLRVGFNEDGTGRVVLTHPETNTDGDTVMVTDSAITTWSADGGTVTMEETWFGQDEDLLAGTAVFSVSNDTLQLSGGAYTLVAARLTGQLDADLAGSWYATSYVLQNADNASQEVDVVVDEGWLLSARLDEHGLFFSTDRQPDGRISWSDTGLWYVEDGNLVIVSDRAGGASIALPYTKPSATTFSFTSENEEGWDFNGDDTDEPTIETMLLARSQDAEVVGTWVAESQVAVKVNDPDQSIDFIDAGGSLTVTFSADGGVELVEVEPDLQDEWDRDGETSTETASYALAEPYVWLYTSQFVDQSTISVDGDVAVVETRYTLDSTGEDVTETITLNRQ